MKLQQLKYVIAVADAGSINEAAKQMFVAQPSLSSAIKELEEELGFDIFKRSSKGVSLSREGSEFVSYAKQVMEQVSNLERRFLQDEQETNFLSVSAQHYAFAIEALIGFINEEAPERYDYSIRECRTSEVVDDVKTFRSEIGILMTNNFNEKVMMRYFKDNHIEFIPLTTSKPHVFLSKSHPLAGKEMITMQELEEYPYLCYQQNGNDSVYFSEEIMSNITHYQKIYVDDRASIFNLMRGVNGYTLGSKFNCSQMNGEDIITVPLESDEDMTLGYIKLVHSALSVQAGAYIEQLKKAIARENAKHE